MLKQSATLLIASLFILTVFITTNTSAQTSTVIHGKTINAKNNETLSFVNLGVTGTSLGTASDAEGLFSLTIPFNAYQQFDLFVSAIGFQSASFKLSDISPDSIFTIALEPTSYELNEVDINAQSRVLYGLLKEASKKVKQNYDQDPFVYKFAYKSNTVINTTSKKRQATGMLYDSLGYHRKNFETDFKSRTYEFNQGKAIENTEFAFFKGITLMDELLNFDIAKTSGNILDVDHIDQYSLTLLATTTFENDSVYVISYKNLEPNVTSTGDYYSTSYEGEIFISMSTKAILKNVTRGNSSKVSAYGRSFVVADGYTPLGTDLEYEATTIYQSHKDQYILKTISLNYGYKNASGKTEKYHGELTIEDFKPEVLKSTKPRDLLKGQN